MKLPGLWLWSQMSEEETTVPVELQDEEGSDLFDPHLERSYEQVKSRIKELADISWQEEECEDLTLRVESRNFGDKVDPKQLVTNDDPNPHNLIDTRKVKCSLEKDQQD